MFLMLTWGHQGIRSNSTGGARPFDRYSEPLVLVLRRYFLGYQLPHLVAMRHPVVADIQSYERIRHKSVSRLRVACEIAAISRFKNAYDRYIRTYVTLTEAKLIIISLTLSQSIYQLP